MRVVRLTDGDWDMECNVACLAEFILKALGNATHPGTGETLLGEEDIAAIRQRYLEGDFHQELQAHCQMRADAITPSDISMYSEATTAATAAKPDDRDEIAALDLEAATKSFRSDLLKIRNDEAVVLKYKTSLGALQRKEHINKVIHFTEQMHIGAHHVHNYMEKVSSVNLVPRMIEKNIKSTEQACNTCLA